MSQVVFAAIHIRPRRLNLRQKPAALIAPFIEFSLQTYHFADSGSLCFCLLRRVRSALDLALRACETSASIVEGALGCLDIVP